MVTENIQVAYQDTLAKTYRQYDEQFLSTLPEHELAILNTLENITGEKKYSRILEIGCGTGRYFHRIKQGDELVGIDPSKNMLAEAKHPVYEDKITVPHITLIQSGLHEYAAEKPFNLIYCFGVLGEHIPFTVREAEHVAGMLERGGDFCFTVLYPLKSLRMFISQSLRNLFRAFGIGKQWRIMNISAHGWNTKRGVSEILEKAGFEIVSIERVLSYPHLLVRAHKK